MTLIPIILVIILGLHVQADRVREGVYPNSYVFLTARNVKTGQEKTICANYLQYQSRKIAKTKEEAKPYPLKWWNDRYNNTDVCTISREPHSYDGSIVPINYRVDTSSALSDPRCRNYSTSQNFRNASQYEVDQLKAHHAAAGLLILDKGKQYLVGWRDFLFSGFFDPYINATEAIPTFFTYRTDLMHNILALSDGDVSSDPPIELRFHRPASSVLSYSMALMWLIAVGSVTGGGAWAYHRHNAGLDEPASSEANKRTNSGETSGEGCCSKYANSLAILFMMILLVGVLMLAYYFRPVLIIIFNLLLVLMGSFSVYGCVNALLSNFTCAQPKCCTIALCTRFPELGCISHRPTIYSGILWVCSLNLCAAWFIYRHASWAWILLNFINFTMCLHILKSLRLPSLKWITGLMVCMFVYDAFMVFLTPYLTPSGCSVMLQVALGMDCNDNDGTGYPTPPIDAKIPEKFPMLMQMVQFDPMLSCIDLKIEKNYPMTILGLGDLIVPGYLVSHCFTMRGFDARIRLLYGCICSIGYGLGLLLTFFALTMMKMAQPALIYLVPLTLLPIAILAACRGELKRVWLGVPEQVTTANSEMSVVNRSFVERPDDPATLQLAAINVTVDTNASTNDTTNTQHLVPRATEVDEEDTRNNEI